MNCSDQKSVLILTEMSWASPWMIGRQAGTFPMLEVRQETKLWEQVLSQSGLFPSHHFISFLVVTWVRLSSNSIPEISQPFFLVRPLMTHPTMLLDLSLQPCLVQQSVSTTWLFQGSKMSWTLPPHHQISSSHCSTSCWSMTRIQNSFRVCGWRTLSALHLVFWKIGCGKKDIFDKWAQSVWTMHHWIWWVQQTLLRQ
jgi:hypothetical protein